MQHNSYKVEQCKHLIECSSLELLQLFKCACNVVWRFATSNKVLVTKPKIKFTIGDYSCVLCQKRSNRK